MEIAIISLVVDQWLGVAKRSSVYAYPPQISEMTSVPLTVRFCWAACGPWQAAKAFHNSFSGFSFLWDLKMWCWTVAYMLSGLKWHQYLKFHFFCLLVSGWCHLFALPGFGWHVETWVTAFGRVASRVCNIVIISITEGGVTPSFVSEILDCSWMLR